MKIELIAFTPKGQALADKLCQSLINSGESARVFDKKAPCAPSIVHWVQNGFLNSDALVFVGAVGIAVRLIAPYIQNKMQDPAVVVLDEKANFAVSLLSGHVGGANALCRRLAALCGAQAVITTATDINGVFAVDSWAKAHNMAIVNPQEIKTISCALLNAQTVGLQSDFEIEGALPQGMLLAPVKPKVAVSVRRQTEKDTLHLAPRIVTVGIGCRQNTPQAAICQAVERCLQQAGVVWQAVRQVASIALKANEPGILAFCSDRHLPFVTFSAQQLNGLKGEFSSSGFVKSVTGVDNVCERSAVLASGGRLICKKCAFGPVTVALAIEEYTVRFEETV